jgi:hypothetical protein
VWKETRRKKSRVRLQGHWGEGESCDACEQRRFCLEVVMNWVCNDVCDESCIHACARIVRALKGLISFVTEKTGASMTW